MIFILMLSVAKKGLILSNKKNRNNKDYNLVAPKSEKRKKFLCKKREEKEPKLYILFMLPNQKFEACNKLGNYTCKTFPSEAKVAPNWCPIHHHRG